MNRLSPLSGLRDNLSGRPAGDVLREIAGAISSGRRFLVTGHMSPDGDSLGSAVALSLSLRALGKEASVVACEPLPERYLAFVPPDLLEIADRDWLRSARGRFDWCAVLDTSEPDRVGELRALIFAEDQKRFCLDHHLLAGDRRFDHHLVLKEVPATASLVLALIDELGVPLERPIARALWLGLSSDTGWFRFANTTPAALRDASRLLATGLEPEVLYEEIYGDHRLERMRLLGRVLSGLRSAHDGRFVWGVALQRDLVACDVGVPELEGVIDHLKFVRDVQVGALITELEPGRFKVSLRSLGGAVVDRVARSFGGGGHAKAAGFRYEGELEELERRLSAEVVAGFSTRG